MNPAFRGCSPCFPLPKRRSLLNSPHGTVATDPVFAGADAGVSGGRILIRDADPVRDPRQKGETVADQGHRLRVRDASGRRRQHAALREILPGGELFILFDIEVVFLYPWAVIYRD